VPVSVTVVPPAVGIEEPPATAVIEGPTYDNEALDSALAWSPTLTIHLRFAPTPTAFKHVIVVLNAVTVQDVAVYSVPVVGPYVAVTGFAVVGPKLLPDIVTVLPPAVAIVPVNPLTDGVSYDTVCPVDSPLTCEPTVTVHTSNAPTPTELVQWISLFAVITTQSEAEYFVDEPAGPYVAETTLPVAGPKFVPVNVTVVPPFVDMLPPPATPVTAGAVYDDVPVEDALDWDPTVTLHTRFAPTPATLLHCICVLATVTVHPLAVYVVPDAPYEAVTM
jgi:hypothetical protein